MDIALDNKASELDNTTQVLISNANTDIKIKTDDANSIFETGDQQNDGLNNIIGLTATNVVFTDFLKEACEDAAGVISSNIGKNSYENDVDMGPETSVDTTDDIDHDTDLLECSTLSHSKETLPSSDNPFDIKHSFQDFDLDDFQDQPKIVSPTSSFNDEFSAEQSGAKDSNPELYSMENPFRDELILGEDNIESDLKSENTQTVESHIKTILDPISDELQNITEQVEQVVINEPKTPEPIQDDSQALQNYKDGILFHSQSTDDNVTMSSVPEIEMGGYFADNLFSIGESSSNSKYIPELQTEDHEIGINEKNFHNTDKENVTSKNFDIAAPKKYLEQEFIVSNEDQEPGHASLFNSKYVPKLNTEERKIEIIEKKNHNTDEENVTSGNLDIGSPNKYLEQEFILYNVNQGPGHESPFNSKYVPELKTEEREKEIIEKNVHNTDKENVSSEHLDIGPPKKYLEQELLVSNEGHDENRDKENNIGLSKNTQEGIASMVEETAKKSTDDENKSEVQLDLQSEEQIKNNTLTSSDNNELDIDLDNKTKEEEANIDLKDKTPLKAEELESITPHESCDESADEWNYMKSKGEETKEVDSEKTRLEENITNNESEESEELIKKDPEEKASAISVEHSEHFDIKYSDSLDKEVEDMTSQLNPEAKEFVPTTSPSPPLFELQSDSLLPVAPCFNGDLIVIQSTQKEEVISMDDVVLMPSECELKTETDIQPSDIDSSSAAYEGFDVELITGILPKMTQCLKSDEVVAQSPRKGAISMEDLQIPTENEFEKDIASKPSEIATSELYPGFNLNDAMQNSENVELASPEEQYGNSTFESADMRTSMYVETVKTEDVLNKVQELPNDIDELKDVDKPIEFSIDLVNNSTVSTKNDSILSTTSETIETLPVNTNTNGDMQLHQNDFNFEEVSNIATAESITKTKLDNKLSKVPDTKKIDLKPKTATSGPKKVVSNTSTTLSDNAKPRTAQSTSKTKVASATTLAARPRTAPVNSSKPSSIEKKLATNVISARAKIETKVAPVTAIKKLPLTKPKPDEPKIGARPLPSKVGVSTNSTSRTASTTSTATAKRVPISTASSTTKTLVQRPNLSPNTKLAPATTTSKPAISPRSTVTSSLRKTEAVKSPTTGKKLTALRSTTTTTTSTTTKMTTKTAGTAIHKTAPTTNPTARKLPSTVTKKPMAIKKSATTSTTTKQKTSEELSPVKMETCEIKMNGSNNVENRD